MGRKWFRKLLRKRFFIIFLLIVQLAMITYPIARTSVTSSVVNSILTLISLLVCLRIISRKDKGAYKLTWVFLIMLFPVFGGLFYLFFNLQISTKKTAHKIQKCEKKAREMFLATANTCSEVYACHSTAYVIVRCIV